MLDSVTCGKRLKQAHGNKAKEFDQQSRIMYVSVRLLFHDVPYKNTTYTPATVHMIRILEPKETFRLFVAAL